MELGISEDASAEIKQFNEGFTINNQQ